MRKSRKPRTPRAVPLTPRYVFFSVLLEAVKGAVLIVLLFILYRVIVNNVRREVEPVKALVVQSQVLQQEKMRSYVKNMGWVVARVAPRPRMSPISSVKPSTFPYMRRLQESREKVALKLYLALKSVEWGRAVNCVCPECGQAEEEGHARTCGLRSALDAFEKMPECRRILREEIERVSKDLRDKLKKAQAGVR